MNFFVTTKGIFLTFIPTGILFLVTGRKKFLSKKYLPFFSVKTVKEKPLSEKSIVG
jgi:hypothetical protein